MDPNLVRPQPRRAPPPPSLPPGRPHLTPPVPPTSAFAGTSLYSSSSTLKRTSQNEGTTSGPAVVAGTGKREEVVPSSSSALGLVKGWKGGLEGRKDVQKSVKQDQPPSKKPKTFIEKFFEVLGDPAVQKLISWDDLGEKIHVFRPAELLAHFKSEKIFNQKGWASFTRQLNIYRFKKLETYDLGLRTGSAIPSGLTVTIWEHETLKRNATALEISSVKRRVCEPSSADKPNIAPMDASLAAPQTQTTTSAPPPSFMSSPERTSPSSSPVCTPQPKSNYQPVYLHLPHPTELSTGGARSTHPLPSARPRSHSLQSSFPVARSYPIDHAHVKRSPPVRYQPYVSVNSRPLAPPPQQYAPTSVTHTLRLKSESDARESDATNLAWESLTLPAISPPPLLRPVPQRARSYTAGSSSDGFSTSRSIAPFMSPDLEGSLLSREDESDYPTPSQSPPDSYFPLDDPSGWSTIGESYTAWSPFHAIDYAGTSSSSTTDQPPPPSGHEHPRHYQSKNHKSASSYAAAHIYQESYAFGYEPGS